MSWRPVRVSAMHQAHLAHGATFRDEGDWRIPDRYVGPDEEVERALATVGLADTSACGKLQLRGAAVETLWAKLAGAERLAVGAAVRCSLNGAPALAGRLADDEILILTGAATVRGVTEHVARAAAGVGCAHLTDLTAGLAALDLIGPRVERLLAKVVPFELAPAAVLQGELARARAILIRLDDARAPGVRVLVAREHGAFVWEALLTAGHELGLIPIGAAARAVLGGEIG